MAKRSTRCADGSCRLKNDAAGSAQVGLLTGTDRVLGKVCSWGVTVGLGRGISVSYRGLSAKLALCQL